MGNSRSNLTNGVDPAALTRMGDRIGHRGPDGEGYLIGSAGNGPLRRSSRGEITGADTSAAVGFAHRRLVDATGARMFFVDPPVERFVDELLGIVRQQNEPFGSTSIAAQWFVFEAARREGMKVMLDGQGADEVLGGYEGYFMVIASNLLREGKLLSYARFSCEHKACWGSRR